MKKTLKLYKDNGTAFPSTDAQIVIGAFTYDAKRMGSAPTISATVMHGEHIEDKDWSDTVYVEFNDEKFYLSGTPSSSFSKDDARYKYVLSFVSERAVLDTIYFSNNNSREFQFAGSLQLLVSYINKSLPSGYACVVDEGVGVNLEDKNFPVKEMYITDVLQEAFKQFEIPYYFDGKTKTIHFGYTPNAINDVFEYGAKNQLVSVSRNNANHKIVTRIFGHGSEENIPYYYPNESSTGEHEVKVTQDNFAVSHIDYDALDRYTNLREGETLTWHDKDSVEDAKLNQFFFNGDIRQADKPATGDGVNSRFREDQKPTNSPIVTHDFVYNTRSDKNVEIKISCRFYAIANRTHTLDTTLSTLLENENEAVLTSANTVYLNLGQGPTNIPFETQLGESGSYSRISFVPKEDGWYTVTMLFRPKNNWQVTVDSQSWKKITISYDVNVQRYLKYEPYFSLTNSGKDVSVSRSGVDIDGTITEGDTITISETKNWINPSKYLMPSIYRYSNGATSYYDAINNTYKDEEGNDISFENIVNRDRPNEHTQNYEDIKPEIKGVTNASLQAIDVFSEFAYDENDSDETITNEDGSVEYKHPYFFGKLRRFDGEFGFNLFAHADEDGEMTISMTSGLCAGCNFVIGVNEDGSNPVQVDADGSLVRDDEGRVKIRGDVQASQQDTRNNEVWVALKKEENSFGEIRPSASFKPTAEVDTFVITNIQLPQAFIIAAEKRLAAKMIDFMKTNNSEKFTFAIKFSRIYLAENERILQSLNENARIKVKYNNEVSDLYVSSFVYRMSEGEAESLPEITVELSDTLVIGQNAIQRAVSQAKSEILSSIEKTDFFVAGNKYFLRKDVDDTASGRIALTKGADARDVVVRDGVTSETYSQNTSGLGITRDTYGNWTIEADFINARKKFTASVFDIQKMQHTGGVLMLTSASMTCVRVEETDVAYRCYFNAKDSDGVTINQEFVVGDQARCQTYNKNTNRYYWRLVTDVSTTIDDDGMLWIDLSKTDYDKDSDIPAEGDNIVQFGYRNDDETNRDRQNAIVIYGSGTGSPSIVQYKGINSYSLDDKEQTRIQPDNNLFTGRIVMQAGSTGLSEMYEWKNLEIGGENLLRNSGFTGDYLSRQIEDESVLDEASATFGPSEEHWTFKSDYFTVVKEEKSQSGFAAQVTNSEYLRQVLKDTKIVSGQEYTISFWAKGTNIQFQLGDVYGDNWTLTDEYQYISKTVTPNDVSNQSFLLVGTFTIYDLKLERGNKSTAWSPNTFDNASDRTYYQSLEYLSAAMKNGETTIDGGLILTNTIVVGDTDADNHNAGINGVLKDEGDNVAFWAGGTLTQAFDTIAMYANDASYQPSEEELSQMAKFVVTHGGLAILNNIILRGYVYAKDGEFNGIVNAKGGIFDDIEAVNSKFTGEVNAESGKIAGFDIGEYELTNSNEDARIIMQKRVSNTTDKYNSVSLNSQSASGILSILTNEGNGIDCSAYGGDSVAISIIANQQSMAVKSFGSALFSSRDGEQVTIKGMSNRCRKVSESTTLNINDDYVIATMANISLTLPNVSFNIGGGAQDNCKTITIHNSSSGSIYINTNLVLGSGKTQKFLSMGDDEWYVI